MTNILTFTKKVPWWGWLALVVAIFFVFGETNVSVGKVSVGGKDLGGFEYSSSNN